MRKVPLLEPQKSKFSGSKENVSNLEINRTPIDVDRTTKSNDNFNLQRKVIRFSNFKKSADPENEFDAYEDRGGSPMKSKHHYRKYRNWTEHEFDKIVRELPPVVSQHQMEKATGIKGRVIFSC